MKSKTIGNDTIYYYPSNDPVVQALENFQLYGKSNFELLNCFIIDDGVVIDCGGHIGTFSVPASKLYDVICIEGAPKNFECLKATFSGTRGVKVINAILADEVRLTGFSTEDGPFGTAIEGDTYRTNTLDDLLGNDPRKVNAIKIDIEGCEADCLLGAKKIIERDKPPMLIEVNGHCLRLKGQKPYHLFKTIESLEYNIYWLDTRRSQYVKVNKDHPWPFCVIDVICIHKDNMSFYPIVDYSLDPVAIKWLIKHNYQYSNEDCKAYFDSIMGDL